MKQENIHVLQTTLAELGLCYDEVAVEKLVKYHDLLMQQNAIHNLTGHKDEDTSVRLNLLNSLAATTALKSREYPEIADIGTGAGLPGIPWSIVMPDTRFVLIDSKPKKVNFLIEVAKTLELKNVTAIQANVFELKRKFETIVFQAFGKLSKIMQVLDACMNNQGQAYLFASDLSKIKPELDSYKNYTTETQPFTASVLAEYKRFLIRIKKSD